MYCNKGDIQMYGFKEIDIAALQNLQAQGKVALIDVRTDAEVARGAIAGAEHLPLHMLPIRANDMSHDVPTVFYCQSGGRSGQACAFMASKGYTNVYNLQGGILAWVRSGRDLAAVA